MNNQPRLVIAYSNDKTQVPLAIGTRTELASFFGVALATVSLAIKEKRGFHFKTLGKVKKALPIELQEVIDAC